MFKVQFRLVFTICFLLVAVFLSQDKELNFLLGLGLGYSIASIVDVAGELTVMSQLRKNPAHRPALAILGSITHFVCIVGGYLLIMALVLPEILASLSTLLLFTSFVTVIALVLAKERYRFIKRHG